MSSEQPRKRDILVTVVAPILGSSESMGRFVRTASSLLKAHYTNYELLLIDGGADRGAIETVGALLKELPCIRIIRLSQRTNRDVMLFAGLEAAIGDYVVVMMPASDPPEAITDLVQRMVGGDDIVFGLSKVPFRRSKMAAWGARLFYWYGRRYLGLNIPPEATYLVGLNRRSINALTRIKGRYRHVRHLTRQVGFQTGTYRYAPDLSNGRDKERGLYESLRLANEIVVSYSHHPLRVVSRLGLIAGAINLLYAAYAIGVYVLDRKVSQGWTTLSLELAVMFFMLFIILSVVCEYIGRILEETRVQPSYHIMEELVSTALVADGGRLNVTR